MFDCVNRRRLLPVDDYSPGAALPPHLSPFTEEVVGDYVPPERSQAIAEDDGGLADETSEPEEERIDDRECSVRFLKLH